MQSELDTLPPTEATEASPATAEVAAQAVSSEPAPAPEPEVKSDVSSSEPEIIAPKPDVSSEPVPAVSSLAVVWETPITTPVEPDSHTVVDPMPVVVSAPVVSARPESFPSTEAQTQPMAYELLLKIVRSRLPVNITAASLTGKLVQIISDCIKFLATVKTMTGSEKKQLVIQAIKDVIVERVSVTDSHQVLKLVDAIGDPIIDALVKLGYDTYLFVKSKLSSIRCCLCKCNSKPRELEIPKEKIMELSKIVDANLQRPFTQAKVIKLMVEALKYMQTSANRKYFGAAKKDVVLRSVRIVIEQSDKLKNSDRLELISILDLVGDDFIDTAVAFGKDVKTFSS